METRMRGTMQQGRQKERALPTSASGKQPPPVRDGALEGLRQRDGRRLARRALAAAAQPLRLELQLRAQVLQPRQVRMQSARLGASRSVYNAF